MVRHLDELARRAEGTDAQVLRLTEHALSHHINLDEQILHDVPTDQHLLPGKHAVLLRHDHVRQDLGLVEQTDPCVQGNLAVVDAIKLDAVVERRNLGDTTHTFPPC